MAMERMRAARLYGPGLSLRLEDVPLPVPGAGEALLRVRAAGICHTELHMLDGVLNLGVVPLTPGHEVVGEVVETRDPTGPTVGQRVLLYYYAPCGDCLHCRAGRENLCPNVSRQFGFTADGGYAEYMVAPSRSLVPLPDALSDAEAVGLACGGATALHAARAVAAIQPGETVAVYGVGGVGFYLVQLCRLAGAKVLAIGRTPEKLALAADLGADVAINARADDPLAAVYEHTGGAGADVVFDLVAGVDTMAVAPRMLARRGRLVFAGYGGEKFSVSPLWLVLRELQVLGAVGNTMAELRETLRLAETGELRSVVGPSYALEEVNEALAALRAGSLVGRAMVRPGPLSLTLSPARGERTPLAPPWPSGQGSSQGEQTPIDQSWPSGQEIPWYAEPPIARHAFPLPAPGRGSGGEVSRQATDPTPASSLPAPGRESEREVPHPFTNELLGAIAQGVDGPLTVDDDAFNALALALFNYQFTTNEPYRRLCTYRRRTPEQVSHWREIPTIPIGAFKEAILATEPVDMAVACFMSSGTTRPDQRSCHYHPDLAVYDASARTNFAAHLLPDGAQLPFFVLNPPPATLPNSSLAHYLGLMHDAYGGPGSGYFVDEGGLQQEKLLAALEGAMRAQQPVCLAGTTFAFVHLLDRMAEEGRRLTLPAGSRVMDTGGVKGRSREIGRAELADALTDRLGIPDDHQVNMYGLTELSTQFLDAVLRDRLLPRPLSPGEGRSGGMSRYKTVPAWARTRVLEPETLAELPAGEVGVLCHTDLANRASVCTILTEDLGVAREGGFEILGRVAGAQARGCSIAMDELLTATRGPL